MSHAPGPRLVALVDQVMAALRDADTEPRNTAQLAVAVGMASPYGQQRVWRALDWLARNGRVKRIERPESRMRYWQVPEFRCTGRAVDRRTLRPVGKACAAVYRGTEMSARAAGWRVPRGGGGEGVPPPAMCPACAAPARE